MCPCSHYVAPSRSSHQELGSETVVYGKRDQGWGFWRLKAQDWEDNVSSLQPHGCVTPPQSSYREKDWEDNVSYCCCLLAATWLYCPFPVQLSGDFLGCLLCRGYIVQGMFLWGDVCASIGTGMYHVLQGAPCQGVPSKTVRPSQGAKPSHRARETKDRDFGG